MNVVMRDVEEDYVVRLRVERVKHVHRWVPDIQPTAGAVICPTAQNPLPETCWHCYLNCRTLIASCLLTGTLSISYEAYITNSIRWNLQRLKHAYISTSDALEQANCACIAMIQYYTAYLQQLTIIIDVMRQQSYRPRSPH